MTQTRVPVVLLTGFLGSGKTSLLNRLLRDPALRDSVVIVNEFGEIPLDHLLITHVDENIRLLDTGCVCCTVRGDLIDTLVDLHERRVRGDLAYSRIFIETSGLVDPAPIFHSFAADPLLIDDWRLSAVVTTADLVNGEATLAVREQARRQIALADLIVLTKSDMATAEQTDGMIAAIGRLNPHAVQMAVNDDELAALLVSDRLSEAVGRTEAMRAEIWNSVEHNHGHEHSQSISSRSFYLDDPVTQASVLQWIELLAALRGEKLLRLKGLIRTVEEPERPMLIQAVQHVLHPVERLDYWPDDEHRSRIVIIGEDLDFDTIERTFRSHVGSNLAIGS